MNMPPVKEKYVKTKVCPFINTKLRKASYKKAMLLTNMKNVDQPPTGRHTVNNGTLQLI